MGLLRGLGAGLLLLAFGAAPAFAQFLPPGFFAQLPEPGAQAQVEANTLGYDVRSDLISAEGRVVMHYGGYTVSCDNLRYEQKAGSVVCEGNASATDPRGTRYQAERIEVTGGMKEAFLRSLTVTTSSGAVITAEDASFSKALETTLLETTYSPCGECIDAKGRHIGWKVKAAKLVQSDKSEVIYFEQPSLEILGMPVAWLPWLWLPDPSKRSTGFQLPTVDYKDELGLRVRVPYIVALGKDTDILLAPQLMTRQGFLMAAEWQQRFDYGAFTVKASGIRQLDPQAFAGTVGNREWRGAIQTSGEFRLASDWVAGWSYTNFSDAAYMEDYDFSDADRFTNEVYATHLSNDFYGDIRLQQFLLTGDDVPRELQDRQPSVIPNARGEGYFQLGQNGQVRAAGTLFGVQRAHDHVAPAFVYGGVPYVFGYEEQKVHATGEVSWQNQYVGPGGIVATPFLGLRADIASFDAQNHVIPGEPDNQLLLNGTPIAAVDVRWPLMALSGRDSHLIEPIAQLVYRGSDVTEVGISNDNAHSFVLDDTNIFSYNRFSGTDRQETGLRANVGARYLGNFDDGSWLELVAGQSFHLAGLNAMGVADEVNTGVSTGLGQDASYVVLGARGSPMSGLVLGADVQLDPSGPAVARAQFGGIVTPYDGYSFGAGFIYLPADAATGVLSNQEEIRLSAAAPLPIDYWSAQGSLSWDLAANEWLAARGEVQYDDGYFLIGGFAAATGPTNSNPNSLAFGMSFKLKGPGVDGGLSSY